MSGRTEYVAINQNIIKNWVIKNHFKNEEERYELYNEFYSNGGECYKDSFVMYQKSKK